MFEQSSARCRRCLAREGCVNRFVERKLPSLPAAGHGFAVDDQCPGRSRSASRPAADRSSRQLGAKIRRLRRLLSGLAGGLFSGLLGVCDWSGTRRVGLRSDGCQAGSTAVRGTQHQLLDSAWLLPSWRPVAAARGSMEPRSCDAAAPATVAHISGAAPTARPGGEAPGQRPGMGQITFQRCARQISWALRRRLAPTARQIPGQQGPGLRLGRRQRHGHCDPDLGPSFAQPATGAATGAQGVPGWRGWLPEEAAQQTRSARIGPGRAPRSRPLTGVASVHAAHVLVQGVVGQGRNAARLLSKAMPAAAAPASFGDCPARLPRPHNRV